MSSHKFLCCHFTNCVRCGGVTYGLYFYIVFYAAHMCVCVLCASVLYIFTVYSVYIIFSILVYDAFVATFPPTHWLSHSAINTHYILFFGYRDSSGSFTFGCKRRQTKNSTKNRQACGRGEGEEVYHVRFLQCHFSLWLTFFIFRYTS